MAKLTPDIRSWRPLGAGAYAERAVLEQLCDGLPDGFDVLHSVDWSTLEGSVQRFGEIDAVVVSPCGHLVLLEIKAVELEQAPPMPGTGQGAKLLKRYGGFRKDVAAQSSSQLSAMRQRLHGEGFAGYAVAHLLVLPDHTLAGGAIAIPRERIVDAGDMSGLCLRVLQVIGQGQPDSVDPHAHRARLMLFLGSHFKLCPDPTARIGLLSKAVVRLADGLATWVPRIHSDAGVYAIEATAGSGKTQLALSLLQDGCARGLRCLYVCYNRPLADHIVRVASPKAQVLTLHELAIGHWRARHGAVDFSHPGIYEKAASQWVEDSLARQVQEEQEEQGKQEAQIEQAKQPDTGLAQFDLLVIDEMQDMAPEWVQALATRVKGSGRLYTLGDAEQSLYRRQAFELAGAVRITCSENVRSPRRIVESINCLRLTGDKVVARCPEEGQAPEICVYPAQDEGGLKALGGVVASLLARDVDPASIAIVTFAGKERSRVLARDAIGGLPLRKFTGRFDEAGNPLWTDGLLLAETLYRFKGQAAPYVVLCEVDFAALDEYQRRKLFVGMTRAQLHLTLVMSEAAEAGLVEALAAA